MGNRRVQLGIFILLIGIIASAYYWTIQSSAGVPDAIIVTATDDSFDNRDGLCSIREALEAVSIDAIVNECDTGVTSNHIMFDPGPDFTVMSIQFQSQLIISEDVVIEGLGKDKLVFNAPYNSRVLEVQSNSTVTMTGLTIKGGQHTIGGGGLYVAADAHVGLEDVSIRKNKSDIDGGGLMNDGGHVVLDNVTITENFAKRDGGGVVNQGGGTMLFRNGSVVNNNEAIRNGGGIAQIGLEGTELRFENSTISNNLTKSGGGGIFVLGGRAFLDSSRVLDNQSQTGGGIYVTADYSSFEIEGGELRGNSADTYGGAIYNGFLPPYINSGGFVKVNGTLLTKNVAGVSGGAMYNESLLHVIDVTMDHNEAGKDGGGVLNAGQATILNSSAVANSAASLGGGIYTRDAAETNIFNTIVWANIDNRGNLPEAQLNNENGTINQAQTIIEGG